MELERNHKRRNSVFWVFKLYNWLNPYLWRKVWSSQSVGCKFHRSMFLYGPKYLSRLINLGSKCAPNYLFNVYNFLLFLFFGLGGGETLECVKEMKSKSKILITSWIIPHFHGGEIYLLDGFCVEVNDCSPFRLVDFSILCSLTCYAVLFTLLVIDVTSFNLWV